MKSYYIGIKYLFFPRLTDIGDLLYLLENSEISLQDLEENRIENIKKFEDVLLLLMKPFFIEENGKNFLTKKEVERFVKIVKFLIEKLLDDGKKWEASLYFYKSLLQATFLLSCYCIWHADTKNALKNFFGEGKFEKGALEILLNSFEQGIWLELAKKTGGESIFKLIMLSFFLSIENLLERMEDKSKNLIKEKISKLMDFVSGRNLINLVEDALKNLEDNELLRKILSLILFSTLEALTFSKGGEIIDKDSLNRVKEHLINVIEEVVSLKQYSKVVSLEGTIYSSLYRGLKYVMGGEIEKFVEELIKLGEEILQIKLTRFNELETIFMQLPPEMGSITIPKMGKYEFDIIDHLKPEKMLSLTNEILSYITNWSREIKAFLRYFIINYIDKLEEFFSKWFDEPRIQVALNYIIGLPEIFLVETGLSFILEEKIDKETEKIAEKMLKIANSLLRKRLDLTNKVLESKFGSLKYIKETAGFYLYRLLYLLSPRIHLPNVREKLESSKNGQELLQIVDKISNVLESIFGKPVDFVEIKDLYT